jgi:hypothetical protein
MSKFTILDWDKPKREVDFIGYNRDRTACFIRDERGARRAINFWLPSRFKIRFRENPIPNSPPTQITRAALHLPACFASKVEMEAMRDPQLSDAAFFAANFEQWKLATRHKCWLEPKDDKKLEKMLREEKRRLHRKYVTREKEITAENAALPPDVVEKRLLAFKGEFITPKFGKTGALASVSVFDVTLADVKRGWHGMREKLLHGEWAKHHGLNLDNVEDEAKAFRFWLGQRVYNARLTTTELRTGVTEIGVGLELTPDQWEILEAVVNFQIRFTDGISCWLDGIEERPVTDAQELDDFDRLETAAEVVGDERMSRDEVRRAMITKWKGESKPMSAEWLEKLCAKARVPFKFPMRRSVVKKLEEHRKRQNRRHIERLRKRNQQTNT